MFRYANPYDFEPILKEMKIIAVPSTNTFFLCLLTCVAWGPDRAPLKEVLGGQYNYREGGRQVLRQGAKGRRRNRKWQCNNNNNNWNLYSAFSIHKMFKSAAHCHSLSNSPQRLNGRA